MNSSVFYKMASGAWKISLGPLTSSKNWADPGNGWAGRSSGFGRRGSKGERWDRGLARPLGFVWKLEELTVTEEVVTVGVSWRMGSHSIRASLFWVSST